MESKNYKDNFVEIAAALQALAHPARLQVLEHLAKYHQCPAGEISNELPISKSTVSQHMSKLREAGFISSCQDGVSQNYRLNHEKLKEVMKHLKKFDEHIDRLASTKTICKKAAGYQDRNQMEPIQQAL
jgi:ArsR family transcriptional regulator, arsenate/arsenite/antimonite-responsive transcriptional repressor